ncbi:DNA topoisomerase I [Candidatus Curtissbacteria bacterium RIFCSPHIGHO2_01_FULL_41_13]|uniref:DNA topoisomerase 1 n=1 Tax=Candidatus Curtissbacteria bacterium RIFCSPHIGHO2_01_FULL_41_13 TaxID=1797745 RepID=A0A1F5FY51_9BACT|nr:MAG: DNA topoisomerase I [Candidatus Curtissbacteria bacterium RIFCSPHIGHO2_01_FULL_41_13]
MKNLVIVESPTKARTLSQFLGSEYQILASMGHVRDLPRGEFGVDLKNNFTPQYVIPKEKIKSINNLAKEAAQAEKLWLATDPDREGEAIAWNLLEIINQKSKIKNQNYGRVVFHEITKDAVNEAFDHPRKIDEDLVEAQQARRVLDRLVGYKLSPLLWKKVKSKLSAGRVQSVALRLVVDREREIEAFKAEEYWEIFVEVSTAEGESRSRERKVAKEPRESKDSFIATLSKIGDKKAEIKNQKQADKVVEDLKSAKYSVLEITMRDARKYPSPPFTTSTLQQAAANRLGYVPKRTMSLAQNLYEQGFITYMRTDSVNLAPQAIEAARKYIGNQFGKEYLPGKARVYRVKSKLAQEAHEAIRPTNIEMTADKLPAANNDLKKLYDLIWRRMAVSQMSEAVVAETAVDVEAQSQKSKVKSQNDGNYLLRANGQKIKFDGWYKVYEKPPIKEQILPQLSKSDELDLKDVRPTQKFTEPPPRYTEATLIRDLEKNGIGRPSTYAPTISTLYDRAYIERLEAKKIAPTPIGKTATDFLVEYFPNIVDYSFTAEMEDDLDKIAQGKNKLVSTMEKFWEPFAKQVEKVAEEAEKMKVEVEETSEKCEKCGKSMVIRYGRFGKFLACSGFPDCKNTRALDEDTGIICPEDGGKVVMRRTKRGRIFWGCANWPKCKFASWKKPSFASSSAKASADNKSLADESDDKKATEGKPTDAVDSDAA